MGTGPDMVVFDFDGVLCDSSREALVVALRTFHELEQAASLPAPPEPEPDAVAYHPLYRPFLDLMPLGNRAEDFGIALAALEAGVDLPDQAAYDDWSVQLTPSWRETFHHRFYAVRASLRAAQPARWLALHRPYPGLTPALAELARVLPLAIATAKDLASVELLLAALELDHLFPTERIADKESGRSKRAHLGRLAAAAGLPPAGIAFIDDKVNHLESVARLGVRCVLAAWGYNGPREHRRARECGFAVARPQTLVQLLQPRVPGINRWNAPG